MWFRNKLSSLAKVSLYCTFLSTRTVTTPFPSAALWLRQCFSNGKTWCLKEWNQYQQEPVQITGTQQSKKRVKYVAYVFVFLSTIIICWMYKWTPFRPSPSHCNWESVLGSCDSASWDVGWRKINQQDATNLMFIVKLLITNIRLVASCWFISLHRDSRSFLYCVKIFSYSASIWRSQKFFFTGA